MSRRLKKPKELGQDLARAALGSPKRVAYTALVAAETAAAALGGKMAVDYAKGVGESIDQQIEDIVQTAQALERAGKQGKEALHKLYSTIIGEKGPNDSLEQIGMELSQHPELHQKLVKDYQRQLEAYESANTTTGQDLVKGIENIILGGSQTNQRAGKEIIDKTGGDVNLGIAGKVRAFLGVRQEAKHDAENVTLRNELYQDTQALEGQVNESLEDLTADYLTQKTYETSTEADETFLNKATDLLETATTLRQLKQVLADKEFRIDGKEAQEVYEQELDELQTFQEQAVQSYEDLGYEIVSPPQPFSIVLPVAAALGVAVLYTKLVRKQHKVAKNISRSYNTLKDAFTKEEKP